MDYTTQLRIAEIIRLLTADDGDTFEPALARELYALIPANYHWHNPFKAVFSSRRERHSPAALTTTGANASMSEDEKKTIVLGAGMQWAGKFAYRRDDTFRQWAGTIITVQDRFLDSRDLEQQIQTWQIQYAASGEPTEIRAPARKIYHFSIPIPGRGWAKVGLVTGRYETWKRPAGEGAQRPVQAP